MIKTLDISMGPILNSYGVISVFFFKLWTPFCEPHITSQTTWPWTGTISGSCSLQLTLFTIKQQG